MRWLCERCSPKGTMYCCTGAGWRRIFHWFIWKMAAVNGSTIQDVLPENLNIDRIHLTTSNFKRAIIIMRYTNLTLLAKMFTKNIRNQSKRGKICLTSGICFLLSRNRWGISLDGRRADPRRWRVSSWEMWTRKTRHEPIVECNGKWRKTGTTGSRGKKIGYSKARANRPREIKQSGGDSADAW